MDLAIMLQACVLTLVALRTSRLFTAVFPPVSILMVTMLQSPVTCKTALRVGPLECGTTATLRAVQPDFILC